MNIMGNRNSHLRGLCFHPGIYYVDENGTREFRCDNSSVNEIIMISGEKEERPACGICGKPLIAFPPNVRPAPHKRVRG